MKVTGFSFIKDGVKYDYPFLESILSILPICDEFVIAVGKSSDETLEKIEALNESKIKIIHTVWDESLREGGKVLSVETNKAFRAISKETDWCFYIQGDEVVHEQYLEPLRLAMEKYKSNSRVDGLLFNYLHFYGSYDYVGASSNWYPCEIRVVKNNPSIYSRNDAQGFRKGNNKKLNVVPIDAYIYHYGWVKEPKAMQKKAEDFNKLWHDDQWVENNIEKTEAFDYEKNMTALTKFEGTHPKVMQQRIQLKNWEFKYDITFKTNSVKEKIKRFLKSNFGLEFGNHNYKKIKA